MLIILKHFVYFDYKLKKCLQIFAVSKLPLAPWEQLFRKDSFEDGAPQQFDKFAEGFVDEIGALLNTPTSLTQTPLAAIGSKAIWSRLLIELKAFDEEGATLLKISY